MEKGKTSRYIKYAIGEIISIRLSILSQLIWDGNNQYELNLRIASQNVNHLWGSQQSSQDRQRTQDFYQFQSSNRS